jgi:hypothetical protein
MPRRVTGRIELHEWADGRTITFRLKVRTHGKPHDQPGYEPRGLVDGAGTGRARADHAADRARHLGATHPEGSCSERPRPPRDGCA